MNLLEPGELILNPIAFTAAPGMGMVAYGPIDPIPEGLGIALRGTEPAVTGERRKVLQNTGNICIIVD